MSLASSSISSQNTNAVPWSIGNVPVGKAVEFVNSTATNILSTTTISNTIALSQGVWSITPFYSVLINDATTAIEQAVVTITYVGSARPYSQTFFYDNVVPGTATVFPVDTSAILAIPVGGSPVTVTITIVYAAQTVVPTLTRFIQFVRVA